eukprot:GHVL01018561.1.p1 GENE.GHVL01018561.1~~GHVL01018561.1.p1  ORF type:complete len:684 (+),score=96.09 GHVL01018561.1:616-2667(+)
MESWNPPFFYTSIDTTMYKTNLDEKSDAQLILKAQSRDRRFPAFMVVASSEASGQLAGWWEQNKSDPVIVGVNLLGWHENSPYPVGIIDQVFGSCGNPSSEADSGVYWHALENRDHDYKEQRLLIERMEKTQEVNGSQVEEWLINALSDPLRHDIRQTSHCITVDPKGSLDLDDALSIEVAADARSARVGVHVADVSAFVEEGSPFDAAAALRASTVYLMSRNYPMLPRALSENYASLVEGRDRLAFSVYFTITDTGCLSVDSEPLESQLKKTIIRVQKRLNYSQVTNILEGEDVAHEKTKESIIQLNKFAQLMRAVRLEKGTAFPRKGELYMKLDKQGYPLEIVEEQSNNDVLAHEMVEEMMVMANHVIAKIVKTSHQRGIFRFHSGDDKEAKETMLYLAPSIVSEKLASEIGMEELEKINSSTLLKNIQARISESESLTFSHLLTTTYLSKALYSTDRGDHWALGLESYTHFTSPIRRYSDIVIHRILSKLLKGETDIEMDDLKNSCAKCNFAKDAARDARRANDNFLFNLYLKRCCPNGYVINNCVVTEFIVFTKKSEESDSNQDCESETSETTDTKSKSKIRPILTNSRQSDEFLNKDSVLIYIPLIQQSRSASLMSLGAELVDVTRQGENNSKITGITINVNGVPLSLEMYKTVKVVIHAGESMWKLRLASSPDNSIQ